MIQGTINYIFEVIRITMLTQIEKPDNMGVMSFFGQGGLPSLECSFYKLNYAVN